MLNYIVNFYFTNYTNYFNNWIQRNLLSDKEKKS